MENLRDFSKRKHGYSQLATWLNDLIHKIEIYENNNSRRYAVLKRSIEELHNRDLKNDILQTEGQYVFIKYKLTKSPMKLETFEILDTRKEETEGEIDT